MTQRAISTLFRLTEAHAKLHLKQQCEISDAEFAIDLFLQLFIMQQKVHVIPKLT